MDQRKRRKTQKKKEKKHLYGSKGDKFSSESQRTHSKRKSKLGRHSRLKGS